MPHCLQPVAPSTLPVTSTDQLFHVRRIYCVGRNYAAHAREMGGDPTREAPFFFCKPADAVRSADPADPIGVLGINYPSATQDLQHEVELVVALGSGGRNLPPREVGRHIFGYGVGIDLTRRDLQADMKAKGRPWEIGKAFDQSAPMAALRIAGAGALEADATIALTVNGQVRQRSSIDQMIWSIEEIIAKLSTLFTLAAGDLIFTGTPEGVGPLSVGDQVEASITGLPELRMQMRPPIED
jgi:fumarylpyruvate hydrolase